MNKFALVFLVFFSSIQAADAVDPDCAVPENRFEYTMSPRTNGTPFDDIVIAWSNGEGLSRSIVDDDGFLTMMALYRSWQTNRTQVIPSFDVRLLKNSIDKAIATSTPDSGVTPATVEALNALKTVVTAGSDLRFGNIDPLMQGVLSTLFRAGRGSAGSSTRGYAITSSDGSEYNLNLCADSGIRTVLCATSGRAMPECAPAWADFCGRKSVSLPLDERTGEARIKSVPGACHPAGLGEHIYGNSSGAVQKRIRSNTRATAQ